MVHSIAVSTLEARGRHSMALRLRDAEDAARLNAKECLLWAGRHIAHGDSDGASESAKMAAIYYRNAGELSLAEHWNMRARVWARGMRRADILNDNGAPIGWRMVEA